MANDELKAFERLLLILIRRELPFVMTMEFNDNRGIEIEVSLSKVKEFYDLEYQDWFEEMYNQNPDEAIKFVNFSPVLGIMFVDEDDDLDGVNEIIEKLIWHTVSQSAIPSEFRSAFNRWYGMTGKKVGSYTYRP